MINQQHELHTTFCECDVSLLNVLLGHHGLGNRAGASPHRTDTCDAFLS